MTRRKKRWLLGISAVSGIVVITLLIAASILAKRFEPTIREQAIQYMQERFDSDVEIKALRVRMPKLSPVEIVFNRGRGVLAGVEGEGISMRPRGAAADLPPLFSIRKFGFDVDLGSLYEGSRSVHLVTLQGMQIHIPPKGERQSMPKVNTGSEKGGNSGAKNVIIQEVQIADATLKIHPKDRSKKPLEFNIHKLRLQSAGLGVAMKYTATLTNPKPPGNINSTGTFGPWATGEPGDTPLAGKYVFTDADLGVFNAIAGKLNSTGSFEGSLSSITARGEAKVPDFRLKMAGNPVPLSTQFEVLVDGTNGNTILQPVKAQLGSTKFTTSGGVIKHEGDKRRSIELDVLMPRGYLRDVLRLAMKGSPFMEGELMLKTRIAVPPLSGKVREKLILDGSFEVTKGRFLKSNIQEQIDGLSRRGQGQPKSQEIDQVVSGMHGHFHLENETLRFHRLRFAVPGAAVELAGTYNMHADDLDFRGALRLDARVSETMTGWKRWALKPIDPIFAKEGSGTFLKIAIKGPSRKPKFGLDGL